MEESGSDVKRQELKKRELKKAALVAMNDLRGATPGFKAIVTDMMETMFGDVMPDTSKLSDLAKRLYEGQEYTHTDQKNPRGRPTSIIEFEDGVWFAEKEIPKAREEIQRMIAATPMRRAGVMLTDEEIADVVRMVWPELKMRQIMLALNSDNLKDVTAVINSVEDRVLGKPTQAVALVDPNKDIRRGWVLEVNDVDSDSETP